MNKPKEVKVYDKDRKTVLATVNDKTKSVGAAKAAGAKTAQFTKVNGEYAWVVKENYTHYPSLKKLVNVNYADPRVDSEENKFKIHAEVDGPFVKNDKTIDGTYVMYEDEAYPGNYVAVHVSSGVNEETGDPEVSVVAMDKNKHLVRDRMAYRKRKCTKTNEDHLKKMGKDFKIL